MTCRGRQEACKSLTPDWWTTGPQLSSAQQQAWLTWAKCIRAHGVPDFADPTFSGSEVHITDGGATGTSPQVQSAMQACKSQMPSSGGAFEVRLNKELLHSKLDTGEWPDFDSIAQQIKSRL